MRFITEQYKIALSDILAVGDSENDICMVRFAGIGVAFCTTHQMLRDVPNIILIQGRLSHC